MMLLRPLVLLAFGGLALATGSPPTWCGKHYLPSLPRHPPDPSTRFPVPDLSPTPLLDLSCFQAVAPYIEGEDHVGHVMVGLELNHLRGIDWTVSEQQAEENLHISILVDGKEQATTTLAVNTTNRLVPVNLSQLKARYNQHSLRCIATSSLSHRPSLVADGRFSFLPPSPYGGSTVKMDWQTGYPLIPVDGAPGTYEALFPIGFYVKFGGYLESNLSVLDDMKSRGFNIVHPVPTFDNQTALRLVLDRAEELGLWLMYDMRWSYMNSTSVREQVEVIRGRKNLLLWYTSDEPDGPGDPLNATIEAYNLVRSLDGYHPISLVLNCEDHNWSSYSAGADILLADPYPLYVNTTHSKVYDTECNTSLGCCGCDNCQGSLSDVSHRLSSSHLRTFLSGRRGNLTTWLVPQALGDSEFWEGTPSGKEWMAMSILGLDRGATGILPWVLPTTPDILDATTLLAQSISLFQRFPFTPSKAFTRSTTSDAIVEVGYWSLATEEFVLVVNTRNESVVATLPSLSHTLKQRWHAVLDNGSAMLRDGGTVELEPYGVGGWVREEKVGKSWSGLRVQEWREL